MVCENAKFERNSLLNRVNGGTEFHTIELFLYCFNVNRFFSLLEINSELVKRFIDAARFENISEVINMLRVGVPVNSQDKDGYSALYWAVFSNHTDIVDKLISNGADVNVRTDHYWTPLHAAAHNSNTEMVKFLLQHGADPFIKNNRGETALDIAGTFLREEQIQQLLEK